MISSEVFEFKLRNPYGNELIYNTYLWHMEDTYDILNRICRDELPYFADAYSLLANTMERFYKGICVELSKLHPERQMNLYNIDKTHAFDIYARQINCVLPIANTKEAYFKIIDSCSRIHMGYSDAKYRGIYEFDDFKKDFLGLKLQRERLYSLLEKDIINVRTKAESASKTEDYDEVIEDDVSYWK